MAMPALATKLYIPSPRPNTVARPWLRQRLDAGLRSGQKLTLIAAPAGFGKTSLLAEWITSVRQGSPTTHVAWLSLDEADNDPARFLNYLALALEVSPSESLEEPEVVLTALLNEVALRQQTLLVLDDFQLIEDATVRAAVVFMLDHLPEQLHVVIASRSDPLLPIARLRARGELTEIRAADLRFTTGEASTLLHQMTGLDFTAKDIAALETRTEGWVAGLQLAALSMRDRADVPQFIASFTGSHRFVIDYLAEEVLLRLPDDLRTFLHQTSVLDRLSGSLCNAVTGRTDSAAVLHRLESSNLFLVPLDDHREWFRYHHLFADVLRAGLASESGAQEAILHTLASQWYEEQELTEAAVQHALAAKDFSRAARLIEAAIPEVRKSRLDTTLLAWLTRLPRDTVARRPVLTVFSAWAALLAGDLSAVEPLLSDAEELFEGDHDSEPSSELSSLPVTISLYRAAVAQGLGDLAGVAHHAEQALQRAASGDHLGRGAAAGMLGLASWARGDLEAGVRAFSESSASLRRAGNVTDALSTTMVVADMLLPLGRLREAEARYIDAIDRSADAPPSADLRAALSEILVDQNRLDDAEEQLAISDDLGGFTHEHRYRWFTAKARVKQAQGDLDAAHDLLDEAERHYRPGFLPEIRPIRALKARVRIAQGRLTEAQALISADNPRTLDELDYRSEFSDITRVRLLLAQGADAAPLLDRLLANATGGHRTGSRIELLVLQARARAASGFSGEAVSALHTALELAQPEGYIRVFVDEGAPMEELLRSSGAAPGYVRRLLAAMPGDHKDLSDRELHVLRLLATALTGPQIARELYISLNTMRTHTKHIFEKLEATSRAEAVQRATELGLL